MEYRLLGSSGCAVSALALGTLTFGNETSEEDSFAQLDRFTEAGGTLVDTADVYADGRVRGDHRPLAGQPAGRCARSVVLATKGRFPTDETRTGTACPGGTCPLALDASLRRLGVDTDRPVPGARLGSADPRRGDAALPGRRRAGRQDQLCRAVQLHRAGSCRRRSTWRSSAACPSRCPCSRSTTCWPARSNGSSSPPARPPGSACWPGRRWPAAG